MFLYADATSIIPGYRTDHSGIILDLVFNYNNERGRGYWKFNNSLLKDQCYIKIVKDTISEVKQTYTTNKNKGNTDAEQIKFNINDQLFLKTLLLMIQIELCMLPNLEYLRPLQKFHLRIIFLFQIKYSITGITNFIPKMDLF